MQQATALIILPNQMFHDEILKRVKKQTIHVFIIEDPFYFYDPLHRPIKPNKIKIAYMRACMKYLESCLETVTDVTYVDYNQSLLDPHVMKILKSYTNIQLYHPNDHAVLSKYTSMLKGKSLSLLESPNFLSSMEMLQTYKQLISNGHPRHATFYDFMKRSLHLESLKSIPNLDVMNRLKPKHDIPDNMRSFATKQTKHFYDEATKYANTFFKTHIGSTEMIQMYPITPRDAMQQLTHFINIKLKDFGPYQDAIQQHAVVMNHSCISAVMNIGLISPDVVVSKALQYWNKYPTTPANSVEGFLRQIIGWREYMRFLYLFYYNDMIKSNVAKNTNHLSNAWWTATTGITPLDSEITKAIKYGYAHHIIRLMVFMNQMILQSVKPNEIYKWFMEVVAIDAYDWVMIPNIYAMGYFWPDAMRKPYISSSNYILKMSDYAKDGTWEKKWTDMYHIFIKEKPRQYIKAYLRFTK